MQCLFWTVVSLVAVALYCPVEGQVCNDDGFYCVNDTASVTCIDGTPPATPVVNVCPTGTYCSADCSLECLETVPCVTTTISPTTEQPFVCTSTGRFPDPTNCSNYYMCSPISTGGFYQYLYNCPGGSLFDSVRRLCTLSTNVTCGTSSTSVSPTVTTPTGTLTTTVAPFTCTSVGRFINPLDCFQYYMCSLSANGTFYQYLYDCPQGAAFNSATSQCTASTTCV
ncbi:probable endochitinase [Schistocerca americana]|uniref:probable endochitinase n=1 Tax=Schistocerca americana TaxID=7009 RepID=UPI001F4FD79C|nr:probable endochitinase [Schistocerca americana]